MLNIIGKGGFAREVSLYHPNSKMILSDEIDEWMNLVIAIGDGHVRKRIVENYDNHYYAISWSIINVGKYWGDPIIGHGTIICPGTQITTNVSIGKHVIINLNCTIGHDAVIGDYTTISPGVNISGNVKIGKLCYIGSNAVIREKVSICDDVTIGAGAVVVKDITTPGTYVGNPCKKLEQKPLSKFNVFDLGDVAKLRNVNE